MEAGASTSSHTQMLFAYAGAVGGFAPICVTDAALYPHPGHGAAGTRIEPEELARFEGEGGLEAPETATPDAQEPRMP